MAPLQILATATKSTVVHPQFKMHPVYKQVSTARAQSLACLSGAELTVGIIKNPNTQCAGLYIYLHQDSEVEWCLSNPNYCLKQGGH